MFDVLETCCYVTSASCRSLSSAAGLILAVAVVANSNVSWLQSSHASWKILESPGFFQKFQDLESFGNYSLRSWKVLGKYLLSQFSVRLSLRSSITRVDQSKMVQAMITISSPSAAWKTLVSVSVKLFHKF